MQNSGGPVEAALARPLDGCRPQTLGDPGTRLAVLPPPRKTLENLFESERRPNGTCLPDHRHLLSAQSGRGVTIPNALRSVHALLPKGHGRKSETPMSLESPKHQKSAQAELPLGGKGEAGPSQRSGERLTAANGNERS